MSNPFIPGGPGKVSTLGKGMASGLVQAVAQNMGLDPKSIDLDKETKELIEKSKIATENLDHAGFLYYIQRGVFLSVLCGDYDAGLKFAKEFLKANNPESSATITVSEITQIAGMYSAILGKREVKSVFDEERTVRMVMIEKGSLHAASKLVSRFARFSAEREGQDNLERVALFAKMLYDLSSAEPTINNGNQDNERVLQAANNEVKLRYQRACVENSPASYAGFVMQVVYNYCVFVNSGCYRVEALTETMTAITEFAKANNSIRLGDISGMIKSDFQPNPQYGE